MAYEPLGYVREAMEAAFLHPCKGCEKAATLKECPCCKRMLCKECFIENEETCDKCKMELWEDIDDLNKQGASNGS